MKKENKTEVISFDEFIDIITNNRGEQIKRDLIELEKKKKLENKSKR